ncbi:6294_t:CDS:2 [Gigaspora rosea]|nr:6294_t:CDS:2 [Gigaspora rosea]
MYCQTLEFQFLTAQISKRKVTTTSEKVNVFKVADIAKSLLTKKVEISSNSLCDNNNEEQSPIQSEPPTKQTWRKANSKKQN